MPEAPEQPTSAYNPDDIEFISKVIRETKAYQAATAFGVPEDAHKTCADELATAVLAAITPGMEEVVNKNDRLSRLLSEVPVRLEQSKRELMSTGWDRCVEDAGAIGYLEADYVEDLKARNPYEQPTGFEEDGEVTE